MRKEKDLKIPILTLFVFILIILVFSITYALYRNVLIGSTSNIIKTGVIKFSYDENINSENGINLKDALPMDDSVGKMMYKSNQYFDFSVSCTTSLSDIKYEIILEKIGDNTISDEYIKVYLTKIYSGNEIAVADSLDNNVVKTYNMYEDSDIENSKILHTEVVNNGTNNLIENYRLRMWILLDNYDPEIIYNKTFSARIRIKAVE